MSDKENLAQVLNAEVNKQVKYQIENLNNVIDETFKELERGNNGFTTDQKEALRNIAFAALKCGAAAGTTASINVLGKSSQ